MAQICKYTRSSQGLLKAIEEDIQKLEKEYINDIEPYKNEKRSLESKKHSLEEKNIKFKNDIRKPKYKMGYFLMVMPSVLLFFGLKLFAIKLSFIGFIFNYTWMDLIISILFYFCFISYYENYIDSKNPLPHKRDIDKIDMDIRKIDNKIWSLKSEVNSKIRSIKKDEIEPTERGDYGEELVTKYIEENLNDDFTLLNDITIIGRCGTTQIDHILITPNNIICIETKNIRGTFYPNVNWTWKNYKSGQVFYSPIKQSINHQKALQDWLLYNGIRCIVTPIVILIDYDGEWKGNDNNECRVIHRDELKMYFKEISEEYKGKEITLSSEDKEKICELLINEDNKFSKIHFKKFEANKPTQVAKI